MSLNSINHLVFVMEWYYVVFEVCPELLNIISVSFGFRGLMYVCIA
jgi:hypothetical protein